jgi:hypothetical protein
MWYAMVANPHKIENYHGGDQVFISEGCGGHDFFDIDLVGSYRFDYCDRSMASSVIQFHGEPKPNQLAEGHPLRNIWEGRDGPLF